jgi:hypothetical protein
MVKRRMAMRMITIFVALIVCGMFFPDLARGEDLSSDQGLDVDFKDVVVGEQKTINLGITNESEYVLTLRLLLQHGNTCTYTINGEGALVVYDFAPDATLNVDVTFTASVEGECNGLLQIMYTGSPGGLVVINLSGNGIEEASETFEEIVIGGFCTGVYDRMDEDNHSVREMIGECEDTAYNHGHLVRCVSRLTRELRGEGIISYQEKRAIRMAAVKAEIRKMMQAIKTSKRCGRSRFWWRH